MSVSPTTSIALLSEITELMASPPDVGLALEQALSCMSAHLGIVRSAISLISPLSGEIQIVASHGLNTRERKRGSYLIGEGITGRVIAEGKPICVPDVSREPLFLNKTKSRNLNQDHISFICVPICLSGQIMGTLSADHPETSPLQLSGKLEILKIIASLLAHAAYEYQEKIRNLAELPKSQHGFIGNAPCMSQVYKQIDTVAPSPVTVLLLGESGTGKELAARAIHNSSLHSSGPFITLNCAALPETLIESELFGYEKGAFTGASQTHIGKFEAANGGTLFLDEVGELSLLVQAKLLRVIQEMRFERLGSLKQVFLNARLITATNRDLAQRVESGDFRRDLFYRLNVFPIVLPPLRERHEDILPLATNFMKKFAKAFNKKLPGLSNEALKMLENHDWPGNVRELQNVMERALLLLGSDKLILPKHLDGILSKQQARKHEFQNPDANLNTSLASVEKSSIMEALQSCEGRINRAAKKLGLTQRVLGLRMKKYNLDYKDFRLRS